MGSASLRERDLKQTFCTSIVSNGAAAAALICLSIFATVESIPAGMSMARRDPPAVIRIEFVNQRLDDTVLCETRDGNQGMRFLVK